MLKSQNLYKVFFLLLILTTFSCENDLDEIRALENKEELPDITVIDLHSEYSINAKTQIKLITPLAYKYTSKDNEHTLFPEGIDLKFYDKNKKLRSSLTADYSVYYENKGFAKAKGNVILTNINESVLKTEELFIDEKEEKIYSVKSVNITDKDGFEITGKGGFESNLDFTVYKFTDVTGKKIINEEEDELLTGDKTGKQR
ncbi:MAG: LPS export ABC transporter periplasmic protein LptC [Bacteroidales bacterium]|nr:LPS export ABC transporter periplasmic protein LptC [Bacteroidales bacterium]